MKIGNQGDWGILPNKQNRIRCIPMHCLPICERHKNDVRGGGASVKNKVVIKDRDEWSSLANFIGNMIAKYADEIDLEVTICYFKIERIIGKGRTLYGR